MENVEENDHLSLKKEMMSIFSKLSSTENDCIHISPCTAMGKKDSLILFSFLRFYTLSLNKMVWY